MPVKPHVLVETAEDGTAVVHIDTTTESDWPRNEYGPILKVWLDLDVLYDNRYVPEQ